MFARANSAGLPGLTSNRSALLVDPPDTDSIAEELRSHHPRDGFACGTGKRRGRIRAAGFTWDKAVAETWKVYASLG
jgi:hypothetical protein